MPGIQRELRDAKEPTRLPKERALLNVFMLGITTVTIRSALDGNPATISLAYFAALAQGLQLLDARPRKSEFVLVALSLFQVILASNLTDSILFPRSSWSSWPRSHGRFSYTRFRWKPPRPEIRPPFPQR